MKKPILQIDDAELPYAYWLCNIAGVGKKTIEYLLTQIGSPETIYNLSEVQLLPFLTEQQKNKGLAERIMQFKEKRDIHKEYQMLLNNGIHFTFLGHIEYPVRLANIPDAPYALYYRGSLPDQDKPSVAIIGARNCSEYGRHMAEIFGKELAIAGIQIISGMARGIDGIGQKEALLAGGYSLGVMGCGVDICYPSENKELYDVLCRQGGICSEYPPGMQPKNTLFPPRNRIISGLSDIVLVIEAKHRSGTLITVDMALEQGKEVYALPGRVTDALSEGCNRLIQQGAGIAVSPQDLIRTISENISSVILSNEKTGPPNLALSDMKSKTKSNKKSNVVSAKQFNMFDKTQSEIISILDYSPQSVEVIKKQMLLKYQHDIPLPELMNQLVKLSLSGAVKQISNSYFVKG